MLIIWNANCWFFSLSKDHKKNCVFKQCSFVYSGDTSGFRQNFYMYIQHLQLPILHNLKKTQVYFYMYKMYINFQITLISILERETETTKILHKFQLHKNLWRKLKIIINARWTLAFLYSELAVAMQQGTVNEYNNSTTKNKL